MAGIQGLYEWARRVAVPALTPAEYPGLVAPSAPCLIDKYDFAQSPCVDYGRMVEQVPLLVLSPRTVDELRATLVACAVHEVPLKLRGSSHSSGGQSLIANGVQLDLRALSKIEPRVDTVVAEGGALWLSIVDALAPFGTRPPVLTDNPRTTVGGTLAVGGFGDSSHRDGLQASQVLELSVATLDGALHQVGPGDPLFDFSLCGRGQLGVIASATMRTVRRSYSLNARLLEWRRFEAFLADAYTLSQSGHFDYFRARLRWESGSVWAIAGNFSAAPVSTEGIHPNAQSEAEEVDCLPVLRRAHDEDWRHASPSLELVFPFGSATQALSRVIAQVRTYGLLPHLQHDSSLMVVKADSRLPLAPLPKVDEGLMIAIRPRMTSSVASACLPSLVKIGQSALDAGAKVYLMSIEIPHLRFLDHQFGDALAPLLALKQRWDPKRLVNRWLL